MEFKITEELVALMLTHTSGRTTGADYVKKPRRFCQVAVFQQVT
jgi:hypothetical protein